MTYSDPAHITSDLKLLLQRVEAAAESTSNAHAGEIARLLAQHLGEAIKLATQVLAVPAANSPAAAQTQAAKRRYDWPEYYFKSSNTLAELTRQRYEDSKEEMRQYHRANRELYYAEMEKEILYKPHVPGLSGIASFEAQRDEIRYERLQELKARRAAELGETSEKHGAGQSK